MNILMSIIDCLKILVQAVRFCVINIPLENSNSSIIRILGFLNPFFIFKRNIPHGIRIKNFLEALGPMFIKFGQLLSTRTDVVPVKITSHLKELTDQCKPFPTNTAKQIIEKSLNIKIDEVFEGFEDMPLAAASLAQVHKAKIKKTNEKVVIKVLRPKIDKKVRRNVRVMRTAGFLVNLFYRDSNRLNLKNVIDDYEKTIYRELDLKVEAANTTLTKKNFAYSELLFIPKVFWDYTRVNVLTLEEIDGIACTDIDSMDRLGIDRKALAENGVKIFLDQVFRDNFFHADMHPGNIFVSKKNVECPSYIAIDCAIVGSLSSEDQYNLARMLQATLKQDYVKLSELFIGAGWVSSQTNKAELEQALRATCEPIFEKPLSEIEFGSLLLYLFDSTRQFGLSVQPSLILLQKTLIHIEGMGREIYKDLDFWGQAEPYIDQWINKQFSPIKLKEFLENNHYEILEKASSFPGEIFDLLDNIKFLANDGKKNAELVKILETGLQNQRKWQNLTILTLIGIIMFLLGTILS
ncbi:MAG: 2-polyprenylphenol hydroxylase [Gammaproteobacteria bacterium]|nr:2-polyprenylphenol hydroxylase [Gammaproteobacteria bacterium]